MSWIKRHGEQFFVNLSELNWQLIQLTSMFIILVTLEMTRLNALLSGQIAKENI